MNNNFYNSKYESIRLEYYLEKCKNYDEFEKMCSGDLLSENIYVGYYLSQLLYKYDKKASVVSIDARLASAYVGNIINGKKNNPSRDTLIRICFALGANIEETQYLLKYAGHAPLYVRRKRDVIIWYGIMQQEHMDVVNDNLLKRGFKPLFVE